MISWPSSVYEASWSKMVHLRKVCGKCKIYMYVFDNQLVFLFRLLIMKIFPNPITSIEASGQVHQPSLIIVSKSRYLGRKNNQNNQIHTKKHRIYKKKTIGNVLVIHCIHVPSKYGTVTTSQVSGDILISLEMSWFGCPESQKWVWLGQPIFSRHFATCIHCFKLSTLEYCMHVRFSFKFTLKSNELLPCYGKKNR